MGRCSVQWCFPIVVQRLLGTQQVTVIVFFCFCQLGRRCWASHGCPVVAWAGMSDCVADLLYDVWLRLSALCDIVFLSIRQGFAPSYVTGFLCRRHF